jgi:hypothetical protein
VVSTVVALFQDDEYVSASAIFPQMRRSWQEKLISAAPHPAQTSTTVFSFKNSSAREPVGAKNGHKNSGDRVDMMDIW